MVQPMTPYVKIDLQKVKYNINHMVNQLGTYQISHRPHVKTHKSVELAKLEIEAGAIGVTCATLAELEVMAKAGIDDILLAYPIIGEKYLDKLAQILKKHTFNFTTIVDSQEGVRGLNRLGETINQKINILLDIDSGGNRGGVQKDKVLPYAKAIIDKPWLKFKGLFIYYGHIYGYDKIYHKDKTKDEANILIENKKMLENNGIDVEVLSCGSTVSSSYPKYLEGVTESRAGNFIFYDMNAVHSGIVAPDQCALTIVAQVISKPLPGKATIDAGSKALTTDQPLKGKLYGYIINNPELKIVNLNEEHGFIEYDPEKTNVEIGDIVEIIPNHSCVIPNLHGKVFIHQDEQLRLLDIDAAYRHYISN